MRLPFSADQFFTVIRQYNEAVWPAQVLVLLMGLAAIALLLWKRSWSSVGISGILALLWTWMGVVYHLAFFTSINPLAYVFGAVSLVGAAVFVWQGMLRRELEFVPRMDGKSLMGMVLMVFALLIYPAWSSIAGHAYPSLPTFGLPCPTTIFTIGMLAMAVRSKVRIALVVPTLWSLVGGQAAFLLDVPPDWGLVVAGFIALGLTFRAGRFPETASHA
jgi:hypothetical protein